MCIRKHGEHDYRCCCGCPIIVGVIIMFIYCIFDLINSIAWGDIFGIVVYGILSMWFITSFVRKECHRTRLSLYYSYSLSFILLLIYIFWLLFFSDTMMARAEYFCYSPYFDWTNWQSDCDSFVHEFFWLAVSIYFLIIVLIRLYFVCILKHYAKEVEHAGDRPYHTLVDNAHHHQQAHPAPVAVYYA